MLESPAGTTVLQSTVGSKGRCRGADGCGPKQVPERSVARTLGGSLRG